MRKVLFVALLLSLTVLLFAQNFSFKKEEPVQDKSFSLHTKEAIKINSVNPTRIVVVVNPSEVKNGIVILDALVDLSGGIKAEINAHIHGKIK